MNRESYTFRYAKQEATQCPFIIGMRLVQEIELEGLKNLKKLLIIY